MQDKNNTLHVVPENDLREHSNDIAIPCPCMPTIERGVGRVLVIHNSWDGREILEHAIDRLNQDGSMN